MPKIRKNTKKKKQSREFHPPIEIEPKEGSKPLTDLSVLNEMAARLRACGKWDNKIADSLMFLKRRIRLMEEFHRYEGIAYKEIKRPFESWEDCKRVLVLIGGSKMHTLSEFEVPIHCLLTAANCLLMWENAVTWGMRSSEVPLPDDIRALPYGDIVVDWGKQGGVIIGRGGVTGDVPKDKGVK